MVERIPPSEGPFLGLHITGDVGRSETSALVRSIEERFARHGPVRLLVAYDAPPGLISAEDLYDLLKSRGENISLSTIYRTLKLMARMGILRELELAEGHKHYEINQPYPHHHHHLVCVQCNKTIEFKNDSISKIGLKQAEKSGLHMLDCQLTIHTVCHEALRMGWPSLVSSNWSCSQTIAETADSEGEDTD